MDLKFYNHHKTYFKNYSLINFWDFKIVIDHIFKPLENILLTMSIDFNFNFEDKNKLF